MPWFEQSVAAALRSLDLNPHVLVFFCLCFSLRVSSVFIVFDMCSHILSFSHFTFVTSSEEIAYNEHRFLAVSSVSNFPLDAGLLMFNYNILQFLIISFQWNLTNGGTMNFELQLDYLLFTYLTHAYFVEYCNERSFVNNFIFTYILLLE